jgi:hypothetical protein
MGLLDVSGCPVDFFLLYNIRNLSVSIYYGQGGNGAKIHSY